MARTLSLFGTVGLNAARFHVVPTIHKPNESNHMHIRSGRRVGPLRLGLRELVLPQGSRFFRYLRPILLGPRSRLRADLKWRARRLFSGISLTLRALASCRAKTS